MLKKLEKILHFPLEKAEKIKNQKIKVIIVFLTKLFLFFSYIFIFVLSLPFLFIALIFSLFDKEPPVDGLGYSIVFFVFYSFTASIALIVFFVNIINIKTLIIILTGIFLIAAINYYLISLKCKN